MEAYTVPKKQCRQQGHEVMPGEDPTHPKNIAKRPLAMTTLKLAYQQYLTEHPSKSR